MNRLKNLTIPILGTVFIAIFVIWISIWGWEFFRNPDRIEAYIRGYGAWGPLVFMLLQFLQVLAAPIPGQVTGFVGGYLFGAFWGTVYGIIGAAFGFFLIFIAAKKFGRPLVERFVSKKILNKFDYLISENGTFVLFLIFLLPAFPDDAICYIAGLTKIKIRTLMSISIIGRLPGYAVLSVVGSGVKQGRVIQSAILFALMLVFAAFAYFYRDRLEQFMRRFSKNML
ncbi:TVP38/TMEM64 family protein [Candidatus Giovannonibacteria bacterium]|nr:TVP38/TMEM64 family protein [Candidatus Giovannonibacteria bacterium]